MLIVTKNPVLVLDEHIHLGCRPLPAPQLLALLTAASQCLLGAHRDEIPLNLGYQPEGKAQHFAVDVVLKHVALFGAVETHILADASVQNGHDFEQRR